MTLPPLPTVAHELRAPLQGVLGAVELLLDSALDDAQRAWVETIRDAADALLRIADDAVDVGGLEAGAFALHAAACDPRALAAGVQALLAPVAAAAGVSIALDVDDAVPASVHVDAGRVRQVLVNLAHNAVKHAARGADARAATIAVRAAAIDGAPGLAFAVRDTGPGMDGARCAALGRAWARGADPYEPSHGAAGLGLALAARLAAAMRGTLDVASAPGAGSTFTLVVPCGAPAADDARAPRRVLVVDDDAATRRVLAALLAREGVRAHVAADAAAALAALGATRYDLVLLDCRLGDDDGCALAHAVRAGAAGADAARTPVVAVTAAADDAARAACAAAGMVDVLVKPVDGAALAAAVMRWARTATPDEAADGPSPVAWASTDGPLDPVAAARLRALAADDPSLLPRVAADFAADAARRLDALDAAYVAGDVGALATLAHAIGGGAASVGATRVAALADALRHSARAGALQEAAAPLGALRAEMAVAGAALERLAGV